MEKTLSNWYCSLRANDKNPISPKKINPKNLISKSLITLIWIKIKITKISAINPKKTTFNRVIKNDSSLRIKSATETTTNLSHEIINIKPWINYELTNNRILTLKKIITNF